MVFFFKCPTVPEYIIYMGKDKYENEELIKYGWREDIWFHVDGLSSAHVYLRPPEPMQPGKIALDIDAIPDKVLQECCQLVKANSIQGSKDKKVDIVYTPWYNLKKTAEMEPGQVAFFKKREVRYLKDLERDSAIVKMMEKTREWSEVELALQQQERLKRETSRERKHKQLQKEYEKKQEAERKKRAEEMSYDRLFTDDAMDTNQDADIDSDDFM